MSKNIQKYLDNKEIEEIFSFNYHLKHVEEIFFFLYISLFECLYFQIQEERSASAF